MSRERARTVLVTGGVACNGRLRDEFRKAAEEEGLRLYLPSPTSPFLPLYI